MITRSRTGALKLLGASARVVLANRGLRRIVATWGLWVAGEWGVLVLLSVSAYDRGGTSAVAVVAALRTLPSAIFTPPMSLLADRLRRDRVVTLALLSWTVLVAAMPLALQADTLLPLYAVLTVAAITSTTFRPAINGLVPQVVGRPDELPAANSAYSTVEALGSLLGPLLTGLLLATAPTDACYFIVAGVFGVATVTSLGIRTEFQPAERAAISGWHRMLEPLAGFPALLSTAPLRAVIADFVAQTATRGMLNVFAVAMAVTLLHQDVESTGALFSALGAGGLAGAVLTLAGRRWRPALPYSLGMASWGVPLVIIAVWPAPAVVYAALAGIGFGNAVADVFGFTLLHRLIPDHLLGRAFGAFWGTAAASQAAGAAIASVLITAAGTRGALAVAGALMTVTPLACWATLRKIDGVLDVDSERVDRLARCEVLAPLTRVGLEQLARLARLVEVPAGTTVIEQGDVGDTFYVVIDGELAAYRNGREARRMTEADCFGEIAALTGTPRTATVTAVEESRLFALDGSAFVLAVTGFKPADAAATALSRERLASDARRPPL
ncbi:MAG: cyclic nucleotide-binding domain-containing protein [Jatrophihabitans sp.]|uniref:cyclic nucleotide-binding domain-containing protein n=1 Tax=Jatrophihabitans sp. TaxID=1932789 RepID=UPI00390D6D45